MTRAYAALRSRQRAVATRELRSSPRPSRSSRRDTSPSAVAEQMELHAEQVDTNDAWLIAADAWEEASRPDRARFAFVRQPRLIDRVYTPVITGAQAAIVRHRLRTWDEVAERLFRRGGLSQSEVEEINRIANTTRPNNNELSEFEIYEFLRDAPTSLFAYYSTAAEGGSIHTFDGDMLGPIISRGQTSRRAFGRGPILRHVTVRTINGFFYHGRCNLETGTYCRLKRGKPWWNQRYLGR